MKSNIFKLAGAGVLLGIISAGAAYFASGGEIVTAAFIGTAMACAYSGPEILRQSHRNAVNKQLNELIAFEGLEFEGKLKKLQDFLKKEDISIDLGNTRASLKNFLTFTGDEKHDLEASNLIELCFENYRSDLLNFALENTLNPENISTKAILEPFEIIDNHTSFYTGPDSARINKCNTDILPDMLKNFITKGGNIKFLNEFNINKYIFLEGINGLDLKKQYIDLVKVQNLPDDELPAWALIIKNEIAKNDSKLKNFSDSLPGPSHSAYEIQAPNESIEKTTENTNENQNTKTAESIVFSAQNYGNTDSTDLHQRNTTGVESSIEQDDF